MPYEVELKFPLEDRQSLEARIQSIGGVPGKVVEQSDRYFAHPVRNFAETDEALRVRTVGDAARVTYKGPLIDRDTKTRHEIEIPVGSSRDDGVRFGEILEHLGFEPFIVVEKTRKTFDLTWEDRAFELALDEVREVGAFAEIETEADEADLDAARASILRLAEELGLENPTRTSYLQMLLDARA